MSEEWRTLFYALAVLTMTVGNFAAITQTNLKRMLAYSTISQMGFVLLGLMSGVVNGNVDATAVENAYSASMFEVDDYVALVDPGGGTLVTNAIGLVTAVTAAPPLLDA